MPWLRVDDAYDQHPKLLALPEVGRWRWTRGLLYCARYRTNGRLSQAAIEAVGLDRYLDRALEVELLSPLDDDGDYLVHDYALYNGGTLEERVALYLHDHPEASANAVVGAVPGNRNAILAAIRRTRSEGGD